MMGHLSSPNLIIFFDPASASELLGRRAPVGSVTSRVVNVNENGNGNGNAVQTRTGTGHLLIQHQDPASGPGVK